MSSKLNLPIKLCGKQSAALKTLMVMRFVKASQSQKDKWANDLREGSDTIAGKVLAEMCMHDEVDDEQ